MRAGPSTKRRTVPVGPARSILRKEVHARRPHKGFGVAWRVNLVGIDEPTPKDADTRRAADERLRTRLRAHYESARLPQLTYEMLVIPMRLAFPDICLLEPIFIALDICVDAFELSMFVLTARRSRAAASSISPEEETSEEEAIERAQTPLRIALDLASIVGLHLGRALFATVGRSEVWYAVQFGRMARVKDLLAYMQRIGEDLGTNATFLATFKFTLVIFAVPHWMACLWWLTDPAHELPSWSRQFVLFTGNTAFEPSVSPWGNYVIATYMGWVSMATLGYAQIAFATLPDLLVVMTSCLIQIVFYAFVLGTLFHYLVRTDENTAHFKELLKGVDAFVRQTSLPPHLARRIRDYFEFQHRKQAAGAVAVFNQLPTTLKVRVASAQHLVHVQHAWVLRACTPQFLNQVVIALRDRSVMPLEVLFSKGDGSRELLWVTSGTLSVRNGDVHVETLAPRLSDGVTIGEVVGEIAFFLNMTQPYTVQATADGDVTLLVLSGSSYDEIIALYPEQADVIRLNVHRRFGLDVRGNKLADGAGGAGGGGGGGDDAEEFELLSNKVREKITSRNEDALTQMMYAALSGDVDAMRALASQGLPPDTPNYDGRTTLHIASAEGNLAVVELLCELGASLDARDRLGATPLSEAITHKHDAVAAALLARGAPFELQRPAAVLFDATSAGDTQRIEALCSFGLSTGVVNEDGRTALHHAAAIGQVRVVELLVSRLADVGARDKNGRGPLDEAIFSQEPIIVQMLRTAGSVPSERVLDAQTAAAAAAADVDRLRFLVEAGASVNAHDSDGRTPLHLAVCSGSISTVQYLLFANANIHALDRRGNPPLFDALANANEVAAILISCGGARLPTAVHVDARTRSMFDGAVAQDMEATNDKLKFRAQLRKTLAEDGARKVRQLGHAFSALDSALRALTATHAELYDIFLERSATWIQAYADYDYDAASDGSQQLGDHDLRGFDTLPDADGGGGGRDASVARRPDVPGRSVAQQPPPPPDAPRGASGRVQPLAHSCVTAPPTEPAAAPPAGGAGAGAGAGVGVAGAASTFHSLVLRLPKAERGLAKLREAYERILSPHDGRQKLKPAVRRQEEHAALLYLLSAELRVPRDEGEVIAAELYSELAALVSGKRSAKAAAPRRPGAGGAAMSVEPLLGAQRGEASERARGLSKMLQDASVRHSGSSRGASPRFAPFASGTDIIQDSARGKRAACVGAAGGACAAKAAAGGAPPGPACAQAKDEVGIFLSEVGYVALLCSPRLIARLAAFTPPGAAPPVSARARAAEAEAAVGGEGGHGAKSRRTVRTSWLSTAPSASVWLLTSASGRGATRESRAAGVAEPPPPLQQQLRGSDARDLDDGRTPCASGRGAAHAGAEAHADATTAVGAARTAELLSRHAPVVPVAARASDGGGVRAIALAPAGAGDAAPPGANALVVARRGASRTSPPALDADDDDSSGRTRAQQDESLALIAEAAGLLRSLFAIFDRAGRGKIRLSDVRLLRGSLGEMGGAEIHSLLAYLHEAAALLAPRAPVSTGAEPACDPAAAAAAGRRPSLSQELGAQLQRRNWGKLAAAGGSKLAAAGGSKLAAAGGGKLAAAGGGKLAAAGGSNPRGTQGDSARAGADRRASAELTNPPNQRGAADRRASAELTNAPNQRGAADRRASAELTNPPNQRGAADRRASAELTNAPNQCGLGERRTSAELPGAPDQRGAAANGEENGGVRPLRSLGVVHFFLGAASWVLASQGENAEEEGKEEGAKSAPADGLTDVERRRNGSSVEQQRATILAGLRDALRSPAACAVLSNAVRERLEMRKLRANAPVDAPTLLALAVQTTAIPIGVAGVDLIDWCADALQLRILHSVASAAPGESGGGDGAPGEQRAAQHTLLALSGNALDRSAPPPGGAAADGAVDGDGRDDGDGRADGFATWARLRDALAERARELRDAQTAAREAEERKVGPLALGSRRAIASLLDAPQAHGAAAADEAARGAEGAAGAEGVRSERPWYVIDHRSIAARRWHSLVCCVVLWDLLALPTQLCFFAEASQMAWVVWLNYALDAVYWGQMGLSLILSFVNDKSVVTYAPAQIRAHYLTTSFALDVLAFWPLNYVTAALGASQFDALTLRLFRLVALRYPWAAYRAWEKGRADMSLIVGIVQHVGILAIAAHLLSCLWQLFSYSAGAAEPAPLTWASAYAEAMGGEGWVDPPNRSVELRLLRKWLLANFFAVGTLTNLDTGLLPMSHGEALWMVGVMVLYFTLYSWAVGQISALVMKQDDEIVAKRGQLQLVRAYLEHIRVPKELDAEIWRLFHARLKGADGAAARADGIIETVPVSLQVEVSRHTHRGIVSACALFRGCSDSFVDRLASLLRERVCEPDRSLYRRADVCNELFVVEAGAVRTYDEPREEGGEPENVATVIAGETLGEVALVFGMKHFNSARTEPDAETRLATLSAEHYRLLIRMFPEQVDVLMDNAMRQYEGVGMTSRSGRSGRSALSAKTSRSRRSTRSARTARSAARSARSARSGRSAATGATTSNEDDEHQIQQVIAAARKQRDNLMAVRLCSACAVGDPTKVQRLLASGYVDVNRVDYDKRSPLLVGASRGHVKVVELLLASQADVNAADRAGRTALREAQQGRHGELVKLLIAHGADTSSAGTAERLCAAAADPSALDDLAFLVQGSADPSVAMVHDGRTALHAAATAGNAEHVRLLIRSRAALNAPDRYGATPLRDAFVHGHAECSALLLDADANMGAFDAARALCDAAADDDVPLLKRLLQHRCGVNAENYDGRTPLHIAASAHRLAACTFLVAHEGLVANHEDRYGDTPFDDAMRGKGKMRDVVSSLLAAFGGRAGSHTARPSPERALAEQRRAILQVEHVELMRTVLLKAKRCVNWAKGELKLGKRLLHDAESACDLEDVQGALLDSSRPEFLTAVVAFAAGHSERHRFASGFLMPLLRTWQLQQDQYGSLKAELHKRVKELVELQAEVAPSLSGLTEVTFRTAEQAKAIIAQSAQAESKPGAVTVLA